MLKKISKKKIITVGALTAIIATGTFAGAQVANSAGETVQPTEITAFREANNSAPAAPALFDKESSITGISLDATTVVAALKSDRLVITKRDADKEVDLEIFEKNETCTGKVGVQSLNVSANGKVIVLKANGNYFSCLTGLTAPEELDSRERVWTLTYANNNWQPKLIESSQPGYVMSNPAINGEGDEIVYTTDKKLLPEAKEGLSNVYAHDLSTNQIQFLSFFEETGSAGVNRKNTTQGNMLGAYYPVAADTNLKMSLSGRYVGWMTTGSSSYTSRMKSDESGNSINNILIADRGEKVGSSWGKAKMKVVPSVAAPEGISYRSGYLLGFNESNEGVKIIFNSYSSKSVFNTSIYNLDKQQLFTLPINNQFKVLSHDGKSAISYASYSSTGLHNVITHYVLTEKAGAEPIDYTRINVNYMNSSIEDIKVTSDRILWSTGVETWELPK